MPSAAAGPLHTSGNPSPGGQAGTVTVSPFAVAQATLARANRWPTPGTLATALDSRTVQTSALQLIDDALVEVEAGRIDRLILSMPPQEGKSTRVTKVGPTWALLRTPSGASSSFPTA